MYQHRYRHRVRFRECDPMGLVYHTHYLDYFEAARTEALRDMGLPYLSLQESGIAMPVVDLAVRYRQPAFYDDLVEVTTSVDEVPRVRVRLAYEVHRPRDEALLVTGHVTLCFVDTRRNRPIAAPPSVVEVFEKAIASAAS